MSLNSTISKAVTKAFAAAGDLKTMITLSHEAVQGFDHITQTVTKGSPVSTEPFEAIETGRSQDDDGRETVQYICIFSDVPDETYQTLEDPTGTFNITEMKPTMEFVVEITAVKEK